MRSDRTKWQWCALLVTAAMLGASAAQAATADEQQQAAELAKQLSNPIASLISVPFQGNWDTGGGPDGKGDKYTLNIQPVVPISLGENWNMISRTIVPLITQTDITPGPATGQTGFGDVTQSFFFSPAHSKLIWGAGPAILLPTGTSTPLTSGKWAAGPTAVALVQTNGWTIGVLANQLWSFAGDADRTSVNAMFVQPFVSYTDKHSTSYTLNSETSCNWNLHGNQCAVPINAAISQLMKWGTQPVSLQVGVRYYVSRPEGTPEWGLRTALVFLFPVHKG
jgi:hypothetical protein